MIWNGVIDPNWNSDDEDFDDVATETSKEKPMDKHRDRRGAGMLLKKGMFQSLANAENNIRSRVLNLQSDLQKPRT